MTEPGLGLARRSRGAILKLGCASSAEARLHHLPDIETVRADRLLVDGHVHFHEGFDADVFLSAAVANLARARTAAAVPGRTLGCLMLAETGVDHPFARLVEALSSRSDWRAYATDEAASLLLCHVERDPLLLIAGRQVETSEGIELLALATTEPVAGGRSLGETIEAARRAGAWPVIPWGFGKWWFRRGRLVRRLLDDVGPGELFLGDSGGRTRLLGQPRLLALARRRGVRVLAGSDPLPLAAHVRRAGSYGFVLEGSFDPSRPAGAARRQLCASGTPPLIFGQLDGPVRFLRSQVALRIRRRTAAWRPLGATR